MQATFVAVLLVVVIIGAGCHRAPTPEAGARALLDKWTAAVMAGESGAQFWSDPGQVEKPYAVRSVKILSVTVQPNDPRAADIVARVESSNKAGIRITSDWRFFLKDRGDGWKIEIMLTQ